MLAHQQAQVCLAIDQPLAALELYAAAAQRHPADTSLLLAQARIQEALGQHAHSLALHQQVCVRGTMRRVQAHLALHTAASRSCQLPAS